MEFRQLVTLRPPEMILRLPGTVLAKVFGRLGNDVVEDLHLDTPQRFAAKSDVEKAHRVGRRRICHDC